MDIFDFKVGLNLLQSCLRGQRESDWDWSDAFSSGQLQSKLWLIREAERVFQGQSFHTAFVLAGWVGLLPALWLEQKTCPIQQFRSFDWDSKSTEVAEEINRPWVKKDWTFKATTLDIKDLHFPLSEYQTLRKDGSICLMHEKADVIINTSCEHITQFQNWLETLPENVPLILQSNNFSGGEGHVNCCRDLAHFEEQCSFKRVLYKGTLALDHYDRFMIIGTRG